ncbi:nucleic-acid-binding protein implicated in transcription termination [Clostridiales bacterium PH28_bin88]|nr:nucleic-acid-binding protein implicated in transcription termination [Clostridiales bacterium PH28_bin88]
MLRARKIPQRMCVGCREKKNKRELIRVVRTPDATVVLDPTGKKAGRGAYICPQNDCLTRAIKSKALERALSIEISDEVLGELRSQLVQQ